MGRPIKRKFFGVDNVNDSLTYSDAGGEGVSSITLTNAGSNYAQGLTFTIAASPIGGTRATGTVSVYTSNGAMYSPTVVTSGTGYTSAPAITLVPVANVTVATTSWGGNANLWLGVASTSGLYVGMHTTGVNINTNGHINAIATGNSSVLLSSGNIGTVSGSATFYDRGYLQAVGSLTAVRASVITTANTIQGNAWTTNSAMGKQCDIVSQRSSRKYRVTNANDTEVCRLVPKFDTTGPLPAAVTSAGGPVAAGQMTIQATDSAGGTYWVIKLDSRTATVVPGGTGTPGTQFAANAQPIWTSTGSAVVNTTVKIATND